MSEKELDLSKTKVGPLKRNAKPFRPGNGILYEASRKELCRRGYTIIGSRWINTGGEEEDDHAL